MKLSPSVNERGRVISKPICLNMGMYGQLNSFHQTIWSIINFLIKTNFIQKLSLNYTISVIVSSISIKMKIILPKNSKMAMS